MCADSTPPTPHPTHKHLTTSVSSYLLLPPSKPAGPTKHGNPPAHTPEHNTDARSANFQKKLNVANISPPGPSLYQERPRNSRVLRSDDPLGVCGHASNARHQIHRSREREANGDEEVSHGHHHTQHRIPSELSRANLPHETAITLLLYGPLRHPWQVSTSQKYDEKDTVGVRLSSSS
jgi:hypothetical protein